MAFAWHVKSLVQGVAEVATRNSHLLTWRGTVRAHTLSRSCRSYQLQSKAQPLGAGLRQRDWAKFGLLLWLPACPCQFHFQVLLWGCFLDACTDLQAHSRFLCPAMKAYVGTLCIQYWPWHELHLCQAVMLQPHP